MSIEKKLTYLKNTKALIRKKLNRFGINVSSENTFRSYVDFLDEILNRYPKSRGQGTEVTLENTIEAPFTIFDVEGNSVQDGSPSPDNEVPIESAGDNENLCDGINQEYWLNTTTLIAGKLSGNTGLIIPVDGVSKYTISTKIVQTRYRVACIDTEISSDGSETAYNGQSQDNTNNSITIDTTGHNYLLVNATSLENIKIEKGTKATPYSPYGMGSINEKVQNKNFFDIEKAVERFENWVGDSRSDWGTYENGVVNIVKSNGAHGYYGFAGQKFAFNKGASCTLSAEVLLEGTNSASGVRIGVEEREKDNTSIGSAKNIDIAKNKWTHITIIVSFTEAVTNARVQIEAANTGNTVQIKNIQLEQGSTATPYVPHEEQDYSIFVQQPMRSNKDKTIKDKFVIKSDNKKYERHWIGEVVLNGTEYWELLNSTSDYYEFITYNSLKPVAPSSYTFPMASHFGNATNNRCVANGNQLLIRVPASMNITNATEFKTWLQENNVTINYLLAEPLDLPCTETQIQQIENKPSTYKDFTIIQSEDETPAYLEVAGLKED